MYGVVYELYRKGLPLLLAVLHQYCVYVQYIYVMYGVVYELYRKGLSLLLAVLHQYCRYVQSNAGYWTKYFLEPGQ